MGNFGSNLLFQFLMVQLKGIKPEFDIRTDKVSIPYGTIKRVFSVPPNEGGFGFNSLWYN